MIPKNIVVEDELASLQFISCFFCKESSKVREVRDGMKEHYKGHIILVTTGHPDDKHRWKPTCKIKLNGGSRESIKDLQWDLTYDTPEEAKRVGLLVSKIWINSGKPS